METGRVNLTLPQLSYSPPLKGGQRWRRHPPVTQRFWVGRASGGSGPGSPSDQDKGGEWRRTRTSGRQDDSSTLPRDVTVPWKTRSKLSEQGISVFDAL